MKLLILLLLVINANAFPRESSLTNVKQTSVNCPAITAYFDGTLQDPNNRDFSITASFGLKLEANKNDKKIHISTPKFNLTKPDIPGGFFNYFYNGGDTRCYFPNETCELNFAQQPTDFTAEIFSFTTQWFYLRILYFPYFDNSFILTKAIGNCTNDALFFLEDGTPDQSLYKYCVCCGDYNPDKALNCPSNGLIQLPHKTTLPELSVTKTPMNPEACTSLIAQYEGTFQNALLEKFNAQFKFKLEADQAKEQIHFTLLSWNQTFAGNFGIYFVNFDIGTNGQDQTFYDNLTNITIPFVKKPTDLALAFAIKTLKDDPSDAIVFNLLGFPSFNNVFKLANTFSNGGQCTKNQPNFNPHNWDTPEPSLYSYCLCCGSDPKPQCS